MSGDGHEQRVRLVETNGTGEAVLAHQRSASIVPPCSVPGTSANADSGMRTRTTLYDDDGDKPGEFSNG